MKTEEEVMLKACFQGDLEAVKNLLSQDPSLASTIDVDGQDWEEGSSSLTLACCSGSLEIVKLLVETGADLDAVGKDGTPLMFASFAGQLDIVRYLLDSGAEPNKTARSGESSLHAAAIKGHVDVCDVLIRNGAKIDAQTTQGTTDLISTSPPVCGESALHLAVAQGHTEVVNLLLEMGANTEITDHTGQKPLHWAGRYNRKDLIKVLN